MSLSHSYKVRSSSAFIQHIPQDACNVLRVVVSICVFSAIQYHTTQWTITTQLCRAPAVVKITSQVNWNTQFSGSCHPKTISAKHEIWHNWLLLEANAQPNQITWGFSPCGWNITFRHSANNLKVFLSHEFLQQAYRTHPWTSFNEKYLITHVSGGTAYLWALNQWNHNFTG